MKESWLEIFLQRRWYLCCVEDIRRYGIGVIACHRLLGFFTLVGVESKIISFHLLATAYQVKYEWLVSINFWCNQDRIVVMIHYELLG